MTGVEARGLLLRALLMALLLGYGLLSSALAQNRLAVALKSPAVQVLSSEPLTLKVFFSNEGETLFEGVLPADLPLRLRAEDDRALAVTAVETAPGQLATIAPGQVSAKEYRLEIPARLSGTVEISLSGYPETALLLRVLSVQDLEQSAGVSTPEYYPNMESLFGLYQPYVVNLTAYEPMYFLFGTDLSESKFQISFKYRLFNPNGSLSQFLPWLSGLHFAYTQTSFWDLAATSAPFEDTSYKPELFLLSGNWKQRPKWLQGLFLQGGIQHESNGRGEQFSRSTNTVYLKPALIFYDAETALGFQLSPKLMAYLHNDDRTNPDLEEYRGNAELDIKFGKASGLVSTTQLRFAEKGTSVQTDLTYPISNLLRSNFDVFFHIQYSNALAESMINYRERSESLRIGFSFVR